MTADLDALLAALYVRIGDHVIPLRPAPSWPAHKLSDAELVCLALAQILLGARECPSWHDQVRLIDATPVPCGACAVLASLAPITG